MAVSQLERSLLGAPDHKSRSALKGAAYQSAISGLLPLTLVRGDLSVIVDTVAAVHDKAGGVVGFGVMVRAFRSGSEIPIDPHRCFVNPPIKVVDGVNSFKEDLSSAFAVMLFESIATAPAPERWGKPAGTVTTVYGVTGDGYIQSSNATYLTARSGSGLSANTADVADVAVGQEGTGPYDVFEGFIGFDTSPVGTDTVSAVTLSLYKWNDQSTTDFTVQARLKSWTAGGLTTADWVAGASLSALTLLATFATSGIANGYNAFASDANFVSNINGSGNTEIILDSDRHVAGTTPGGSEYVVWADADSAGTTNDPKLVITHAGAAVVPAMRRSLLGVGF